jgi:hypothetical protein
MFKIFQWAYLLTKYMNVAFVKEGALNEKPVYDATKHTNTAEV